MKKHIFLGFIIVLLFMLPVSLALAMTTASPPTAINGNELTSITADPSATIVHPNAIILDATNVGITVDNSVIYSADNADLIPANIKIDTGQDSSVTSEEDASTADYAKTNGKDVDGANATITRNTDTAITDDSSVANAINSSADGYTFVGNTADIRSTKDADAQQFKSEVAYVLKIVIPAGSNVENNDSVESAMMNTRTDLSGLVTTLKKPIDLVENNTGAITTLSTNSLVNTAINTPTASATIDYSMLQTGHEVRTLTSEELASTYRMYLSVTTSATEEIAMPDLAMITSAATIYFIDITVTAMVQNQENAAYANDLVVAGIESEAILVDAIADTAMGKNPTTTYNAGTFAFDIAGAGLTLNAA